MFLKPETFVLSNGLRVVVVSNPYIHSLDLTCIVRVGALNDGAESI